MIYLHSKRLLFFKAKKVAGTSFEIALSHYADDAENDVITTISPIDEVLRLRAGAATPRNWTTDKQAERDYVEAIRALDACTADPSQPLDDEQRRQERACKMIYRRCRQKSFAKHMLPEQVEAAIGAQIYADAYKTSIVRDPFEMLVSQAFWKLRDDAGSTTGFSDMVDLLIDEGETNIRYYRSEDGTDICDLYIRYEHLQDDITALDRKLGTDIWNRLPKTKHQVRKDRRPARELLTAVQKSAFYERNREVFDRFGYAP